MRNKPELYVVATPIGNLGDISSRAIDVLRESELILAEDTRVAGKLLSHFDIDTHVLTYNQHTFSDAKKRDQVALKILSCKKAALVSDAGTPGISDPGNELIEYILSKEPDFQIVPIPGPSAVTATLSVCGFKTDDFRFIGYFPKKKKQKLVSELASQQYTIVFFESPHRIVKTLEMLLGKFSDRRFFIARELTKVHESHYRGLLPEAFKSVKSDPQKGEYVVVIEGN